MLFYEQAVSRRDTGMEKGLLDHVEQNNHVALPFPGKAQDMLLLFKEQRQTRSRRVFCIIMWHLMRHQTNKHILKGR